MYYIEGDKMTLQIELTNGTTLEAHDFHKVSQYCYKLTDESGKEITRLGKPLLESISIK